MSLDLVRYQEEIKRLEEVVSRLGQEANAKAVFLIDQDGRPLASSGEFAQFDATSLASLMAGHVVSTNGVSEWIGEREFSVVSHEGPAQVNVSIIANYAILVVIFDERSSLGLVRLRVKRATVDFERIFAAIMAK